MHAIRGTGAAEKQLKNAKTELPTSTRRSPTTRRSRPSRRRWATTETAKLARGIRREEERMAKFLTSQITVLSKQVAREEVPAAERKKR